MCRQCRQNRAAEAIQRGRRAWLMRILASRCSDGWRHEQVRRELLLERSGNRRAEILGEVAKIHESTGRMDRSEQVHRQIMDLAPEDPGIALPAARALEKIYVITNRGQDLAAALRVQVKLESDSEVRRTLLALVPTIPPHGDDLCANALSTAIQTAPDAISAEAAEQLGIIYQRYARR